MVREICDVCQKNDADRKYKIKRSAKCYMPGAAHLGRIWNPYEKIVICNECAEKLFSVFLRAKVQDIRNVEDKILKDII